MGRVVHPNMGVGNPNSPCVWGGQDVHMSWPCVMCILRLQDVLNEFLMINIQAFQLAYCKGSHHLFEAQTVIKKFQVKSRLFGENPSGNFE